MTDTQYDIVVITNAEPISGAGLIASQVMATLKMLAETKHSVSWIAVVPVKSELKDLIKRRRKISEIGEKCRREGVRFAYFLGGPGLFSAFAFLLKGFFRRYLAKRAAKVVLASLKTGKVVLHARSYYAADLAIRIREILVGKGVDARVSFDMRSLLAAEFPLVVKHVGSLLYGPAKKWEHTLLSRADISFLPLHRGADILHLEGGSRVRYLPISGFTSSEFHADGFAERWRKKQILFVGTPGAWNDERLLSDMLNAFRARGFSPKILSKIPSVSKLGFPTEGVEYERIPAYYRESLAVVVPGRAQTEDFFELQKCRINFFSTKAAEALSVGVPLIVGPQLYELQDYVSRHDCGVVYRPDASDVFGEDTNRLEDPSFWEQKTRAAMAVAPDFARESVIRQLTDGWEKLFEADVGMLK